MRPFQKTIPVFLLLNLISFILASQHVQYINGQWFNGTSFEKQVWYSVNGLLTKSKPLKIDTIINLSNGYVVPPFGEAHNHNISGENPNFKNLSNQYLRTGIYYVKNPNSLREDKETLSKNRLINHPRAIDATFAGGGITATGGHPSLFFNASTKGEGNFYHTVNSAKDIDLKWEAILKNNPDFIKTYLLFSEEFEARNGKGEFVGNTGLDPSLLPLIVKKAHANGFRVASHVETGNDFHVAIISGVDEIAHMPGFRGDPRLGIKLPPKFEERFSISKQDAELAAKNKVVVTTTIGDLVTIPMLFALRRKGDLLQKRNLTTLKNAGVIIAMGSDSYEKNSMIELSYLKDSGVFSDMELLKILCQSTPQSIFPGRKIGQLSEGYEASFLVLSQNPLQTITALTKIIHWVKQGVILDNQLRD